jgi:hypothetical protein
VANAISINEVAWMGSPSSANHEWIELHHDGDTTLSVDGWVLTDGMNLSINLVGTILPGQYVVLERSNEESASGPAFLIYTGALVNTGATLVLKDSLGNIMDQVAGGENWELIGGDNVTKETAQYTSGGWVTDVATPGMVNRGGRAEVSNEKSDEASLPSNADKKKSEEVPKSSLIKMTAPSVVFVHQAVVLKAETNQAIKTTRFNWSFGDSHQATGTAVTHRYAYPGTYIIAVSGRVAGEDLLVEKEVTVLPLAFSLGTAPDGSLQLHNDSHYDVDISSYSLYAGRVVKFPEHTKIKARGTITIPWLRLGGNDEVRLVSENGLVLPLATAVVTPVAEKSVDSGLITGEVNEKPTAKLPETVEIKVPAAIKKTGDTTNIMEISFMVGLLLIILLVLWKRPIKSDDDKVSI